MGFRDNIEAFKICLLGFVFCLFILCFFLDFAFCFRPQSGENGDGTRKRTWLLTKLNSCFLSMERKAANNPRDPESPTIDLPPVDSEKIKRLENYCARFEPQFAEVETFFRKLGPKKPPKPKETTFQLVRRHSLQRMDSIATLVNEKLSESAVMKAEQVKMKEQLSRFQSLVQSHEARIASLEKETQEQKELQERMEAQAQKEAQERKEAQAQKEAQERKEAQAPKEAEVPRKRSDSPIEERKALGLAAEIAQRRKNSPPPSSRPILQTLPRAKSPPRRREMRSEVSAQDRKPLGTPLTDEVGATADPEVVVTVAPEVNGDSKQDDDDHAQSSSSDAQDSSNNPRTFLVEDEMTEFDMGEL